MRFRLVNLEGECSDLSHMETTMRLIRRRFATVEFLDACSDIADVPNKNAALDPQDAGIRNIALNAAVTHPNLNRTRFHIGEALDCGATSDEVMEVFELISILGIHACSNGASILLERIERSQAAKARAK